MLRQTPTNFLLFSCLGLVLLSGCNRSFVRHGPVSLAVSDHRMNDELFIQWLGVSSWIISRGNDVVVVDPFFSRPPFPSVMFSLAFPSLAGNFGYNVDRINDVLPDLPEDTRFVLLGHAHYDHLMDVPYYMKRKSGQTVTYVGSQTAYNILAGFKPAHLDFVVVAQEGRRIETGKIRITALPSDHAPHFFGHKFMSGKVHKPMDSFPTNAGEYVDGQTLVYFIDFLHNNNKVLWRVFVNGAASSPDGAEGLKKNAEFIKEYKTNVAILCVPGWDKVRDYPNSILGLVKPDIVMLSHYDDFGLPYKNGEDPRKGMKFVPFANYAGFVKELKNLREKYNYRYKIYKPKTGQCIRFPASGRNLTCEQ